MGITRRFNADGSKFEAPPSVGEGSVVYFSGQRLMKTVKRAGTGGYPGPGDEVSVHYVGTLEDGTVFDSSRRRKKPFKFTLGQGSVIEGWEQSIESMQVGELVELKCAPEFAYGSRGSPPNIPPDATLTFEIELLDFHSVSIGEIVFKNGAYLLLLLAGLFALLHYVVLPGGAIPAAYQK
mmetsp:Transcript_5345/g.10502  ORF Transcript_5345/g.10502 Transcript_5345/m.10502 type:complete len:180 (+) Transcript_5345:75-614(+)|eukprot:CAMPEP_0119069782 /NCGR_PEP_ID=MMETSP1178-20130426/28798_1 /TAXON_ID=33656 /ORGANISM="unid sp, Strain CCMP2000" /LENGTH=179 /DNA_ID=CAMNT_0007051579 /DNA_START=75 /DNA_END=614 /DNA_ORIENTATION=+